MKVMNAKTTSHSLVFMPPFYHDPLRTLPRTYPGQF